MSNKVLVFLLCAVASTSTILGRDLLVNGAAGTASDDGQGTVERPFKTISAAVTKLVPGDTLTVKAGIYREAVEIPVSGTKEQPVTLQAARGETAVISGADLVSGWEKVPDEKRPIWKKSGWPAWKNFKCDPQSRGEGPQIIVDSVLLPLVESPAKMHAGSFTFDPGGGGTIYLWMNPPRAAEQKIDPQAQWWENPVNLASDDPNQHQVEASVRNVNLSAAGRSYLVVRGFVIRYNTAAAQVAGLSVIGTKERTSHHVTVEDCVVENCHGRGLSIAGEAMVVRRCYLRWNGASGAGGELVDSLFEGNVLDGNTALGHSHGWEAGGVKFVRTRGLTVRNCTIVNNNGPGLWFDWGNSGNVVEGNYCSYNSGSGIMMEVSPHFDSEKPDAKAVISQVVTSGNLPGSGESATPNILRNNVCVGNRWDGTTGSGILLQLASKTFVLNNTIVGNEQFGIFIRYHPYDKANHRCVDDVLLNNLCADNGGSQIEITPDPVDKPGYVARNRSDFNLFWSTVSWLTRNEGDQQFDIYPDRARYSRWGKTEANGTYSLEEWTKIRGFDQHSIQQEPRFVAPSLLDYRLRIDSPAIAAGEPTEWVTNDYLGRKRPSSRAPSIGALEFFPEDMSPVSMPMHKTEVGPGQ
ncbi:MAG: right-handed parallel beta-helix repeat-containing protein [Chthoniobacteraceae bacterium]